MNVMRGAMNVLHPMTGDTRARATLTITAEVGLELLLKPNSWVFPVIGGGAGSPQRMRPDLLFKIEPNPDREDGFWQVFDTGNAIPVVSNLAGVRHNVAVGTRFAFDFNVPGIASMLVATLDTPATDPDADGTIKSMVIFEQAQADFWTDLKRAEIVTGFPAVVVAFDDMQPADGSTVDSLTRRNKMGTDTSLYRVDFQMTIFSSRNESDNRRRMEGLAIADGMIRYLTDARSTEDGDCVSSPGGLQILQMFRNTQVQSQYQKYYVYTILVAATVTLVRTDNRTFQPWLSAILNVNKPQNPAVANEGPLAMVENVIIDMAPADPVRILEGGAGASAWWNVDFRNDGLSPAIATLLEQTTAFDLDQGTPAQQPTLIKLSNVLYGRMVAGSVQHWHGEGAALWPAAASDVAIWFTMRATVFTGPAQTLFSASDVTQTTVAIELTLENGMLTLNVPGIGSVTIPYQDPNIHLFRLHVGGGEIDLSIDGVIVAFLVAAGTVAQAGESINIGTDITLASGSDVVFHEMAISPGTPSSLEETRMTKYMTESASIPLGVAAA